MGNAMLREVVVVVYGSLLCSLRAPSNERLAVNGAVNALTF